jgi:hypothetical protein
VEDPTCAGDLLLPTDELREDKLQLLRRERARIRDGVHPNKSSHRGGARAVNEWLKGGTVSVSGQPWAADTGRASADRSAYATRPRYPRKGGEWPTLSDMPVAVAEQVRQLETALLVHAFSDHGGLATASWQVR